MNYVNKIEYHNNTLTLKVHKIFQFVEVKKMNIKFENIKIREAEISDANILTNWWNDGKVMAHAGFPRGLGTNIKEVEKQIKSYEGKLGKLCIIEIGNIPIGEMSYGIVDGFAEVGWKLCDENFQNKGYGTKIINKTFEFIFNDKKINDTVNIEKIIWDTNLNNKRAQKVYEDKVHAIRVKVEKDAWEDQNGELQSSVLYEMPRERFEKLHKDN